MIRTGLAAIATALLLTGSAVAQHILDVVRTRPPAASVPAVLDARRDPESRQCAHAGLDPRGW